jgi:AcrR family transcriptional regulator
VSAAKSHLDQKIVDTALNLADRRDWESVRLHDIAAEEKISLDDIRHHYREKEDLVDAWFDRADQAMLKVAEDEAFQQLDSKEKLHTLLMSWLDTLAAHRRVTRQMIFGKLEIGHLHYQINGLLRVSRTVQWLREAAGRDTRLPLRAIEETGLTALYLATFLHWMFDDSHGSKSTSQFLHRRLGLSETSRMPD